MAHKIKVARRENGDLKASSFNYIDLFAGCGGFSLGLKRAGMNCIAAVDRDSAAVACFRENFPEVPHVLERDLTDFAPEQLRTIIGDCRIDAVFGGPPCQGFSKVRRVDGTNNGARMVHDPRRLLYRNYLHYVEYFKPAIFVMENVPGIRNAAGGEFFTAVQSEARKLGYRVHSAPAFAWQYGVPQKRERQLIIGTRCDLPIFSTTIFVPRTHEDPRERVNSRRPAEDRRARGRPRSIQPPVTLWEAIGDLPPVAAGGGVWSTEYDGLRGREHLERYGRRFLIDVLEVDKAESLTAHVARPHSERDLRDFDRLREGETSKAAIERGEKMEFPYDRSHFKDRYTKQHREKLCSTIVAHLSKDGLMFIHPTQRRSLTVREAARLQTFPDWFSWPKQPTAAFRLIGNAVPPLLAEAIGRGVKRYLSTSTAVRALYPIPKSPEQAAKWLSVTVRRASSGGKKLREVPKEEFKRAWFSIGFLHNWLHPDSALLRDDRVLAKPEVPVLLSKVAPEIAAPIYETSGWPVPLVPIALEAARRFQQGMLNREEYYCSQAQIAGLKWTLKHSEDEWHQQCR